MATGAPRVIFILGTAYCGSTLLGLCLSNRPDARFVGEIYDVYKGWRAPRCSCRFVQMETCSFWPRFTFDETIYQQLTARFPLVVDGSKYPEWILPHARAMADSRVVVMFKDPESYLLSWRSRGKVLDWGQARADAATKPVDDHLELYVRWYEQALNADVADRIRFLSLDAFTRDPVGSLIELLAFLGLPYRPGQERYWENRGHHILGSSHRVFRRAASTDLGAPIVPAAPRREALDEIAAWEHRSARARETFMALVRREAGQRAAMPTP